MKWVRYKPKQFELPAEGVQRGKLVEIEELGKEKTPSGEEKDKVRFIWELDQTNSSGAPFQVREKFNRTMHPDSWLHKAVAEIIGRDPGTDFDLDTLQDVEVDLVLKHSNPSEKGVRYANVVTHLRPKTKAEAAEERSVSVAILKVKQGAALPPTDTPPAKAEGTDNDIPF